MNKIDLYRKMNTGIGQIYFIYNEIEYTIPEEQRDGIIEIIRVVNRLEADRINLLKTACKLSYVKVSP
jgi:hypothetical protein